MCLNGQETTTEEEANRLGNNSNRETMCTPQFAGTERQRTPEEHEKANFAKLYPPTGPPPALSPPAQATTSGAGQLDETVEATEKGLYTVQAPRDPTRATTLSMIYGDGAHETKTIPQGSGVAFFHFEHASPAPAPIRSGRASSRPARRPRPPPTTARRRA